MMNIEQLTSRLAQMPDQALQQYAMMHKDDPYIMALAISESRRRKQLRASAVPPMAPQEKVADQALMEMGVGALPTQEMDFASGGIVAFADGGDVERYQDRGLVYESPYDRMNRLNREREERERQERLARITAEGGNVTPYGEQMGNLAEFFGRAVPNPLTIAKTLVSAPGYGFNRPAPAAPPADAVDRLSAGDMALRQQEPPSAAPVAAPAPAPRARSAGLAGTPEAAALAKTSGAPSVQGAKDTAGQFLDTAALRAELAKFEADEKAAVDAARKRRTEGKPEGVAYSKYEEMLKAEESGAAKEKSEAQGLALFKAGLAMMAGSSPRAFENIGKGALVGLEEYSGALKDMKKAAKERQKAMADIEQARRAEARDDWKTAGEFEDKAEARMSKARELGVKGIMDITGKSAEIAAGVYKTQVEQQGALQRTAMQVAALKDRSAGGEETRTLNELKALQTSLQNQLKTEFNRDQRMSINAQLAQVNAAIARMAGLGTMPGAPGAPSPGGTTRMRFDAQGNLIQ